MKNLIIMGHDLDEEAEGLGRVAMELDGIATDTGHPHGLPLATAAMLLALANKEINAIRKQCESLQVAKQQLDKLEKLLQQANVRLMAKPFQPTIPTHIQCRHCLRTAVLSRSGKSYVCVICKRREHVRPSKP